MRRRRSRKYRGSYRAGTWKEGILVGATLAALFIGAKKLLAAEVAQKR